MIVILSPGVKVKQGGADMKPQFVCDSLCGCYTVSSLV